MTPTPTAQRENNLTPSDRILIMPADILSGAPADTADTSGQKQRTPADTPKPKPRKTAESQRTRAADAADTPSGHRPPPIGGTGRVSAVRCNHQNQPVANTPPDTPSWTVMASTYTDDDRAHAIERALEVGSITNAAEAIGIPPTTLRNWMTPEQRAAVVARGKAKTDAAVAVHQAKLNERRAALRVKLLERAERMLDRMTEPEVDYRGQQAREVEFPEASPASCKALATSAAILIDKLRLELGEVTDRTEHRSTDAVTEEIQRLAAQMAEAPV